MTEDLAWLSAGHLLEFYRRGDVSPVEATRAALDRIAAHNEALNAFCLVDEDAALDAARRSEERWSRAEPAGRLDGVPVSIKDIVLTRGWPTLRGSTLSDPDQAWEEDAPCIARLREHNAVLLGKTTTPEFGWKGVTDSPLTGISRNPWDLDKTPGGSSGGSAAALAAGMGALSIGSDGGGSIRIPSSFSGVVGIKANFGRVPVYPASPFGTLSHVGPMARSVEDLALMLSVLSEPDARDWFALPSAASDFSAELNDGVAGLRIGFSADLGGARVDPEVADVVAKAAAVFETLGARVEAVDLSARETGAIFKTLWYVGARRVVQGFTVEQQERLDPGLRIIAAQGEDYDLNAYLDAVGARTAFGMRMNAFHERYDLLLTPTMPTPAFAVGRDQPIGSNGEEWVDWSPFTYPFNLTGQPALSIPCGATATGLPVGLQIVGRNFDEAGVLRAARAYEASGACALGEPVL